MDTLFSKPSNRHRLRCHTTCHWYALGSQSWGGLDQICCFTLCFFLLELLIFFLNYCAFIWL